MKSKAFDSGKRPRAWGWVRGLKEPLLLALSGFLLMMSLAAIGEGNRRARAAESVRLVPDLAVQPRAGGGPVPLDRGR